MFDVGGRDKVQRRLAWAGEGGGFGGIHGVNLAVDWNH